MKKPSKKTYTLKKPTKPNKPKRPQTQQSVKKKDAERRQRTFDGVAQFL